MYTYAYTGLCDYINPREAREKKTTLGEGPKAAVNPRAARENKLGMCCFSDGRFAAHHSAGLGPETSEPMP